MGSKRPGALLIAAAVCAALCACGARPSPGAPPSAADGWARALGGADLGLSRLSRAMPPDALALARRFDPAPHPDLWGRPAAWPRLQLEQTPRLPLGPLSAADAALVNAALPTDDADFAPAQPFFLKATGAERARAVLCLAQAVYYEAALQPLAGQQAVAQTVINRLRHPDFPKSVCGVVFQGSQTPIFCQYSFTCDGSLARAPIEPYWSRARAVAEAALDGFVAAEVGPATHYHADYVFPPWGPQMVKIVQLGAHIFYRYPGPIGDPAILTGRYRGHELAVSITGPTPEEIAAARALLSGAEPPPVLTLAAAPLAAAPLAAAPLAATPLAAAAPAATPPRATARGIAAPAAAPAAPPALRRAPVTLAAARPAAAPAVAERAATPAAARVRVRSAPASSADSDRPIATAGGDRG